MKQIVKAKNVTLEDLIDIMAGMRRIEMEVNNHGVIYKLTAYWVKDLMRIDIKGDKDGGTN